MTPRRAKWRARAPEPAQGSGIVLGVAPLPTRSGPLAVGAGSQEAGPGCPAGAEVGRGEVGIQGVWAGGVRGLREGDGRGRGSSVMRAS